MKFALNSEQMKKLDDKTIHTMKIPSLVLMERAALAVAEAVMKKCDTYSKIVVVCGCGNNGGDGFAVTRILSLKGYHVDILLVGKEEKMTPETKTQMEIVMNLGLSIRRECDFSEYNVIVDSMFGIGLDREVQGEYAQVIHKINEVKGRAYIIAVDIPSGLCANSGQILGCAVQADETVTFQEMKIGLLLYPGANIAGKVTVVDIGILPFLETDTPTYCYYEETDILKLLPKRVAYSNKGTYGKVLIIAGSDAMTGAAYLSAYAAYRMGCGLVKVLTAKNAIPIIRQLLPEALTACYDGDDATEVITNSLLWADVVVIGPGITTSSTAYTLCNQVFKQIMQLNKPLVVDADAINVIAGKLDEECKHKEGRIGAIQEMLPRNTILTPHLGELSRLTLDCVNKVSSYLIDITDHLTYNCELIYVLKDTRTIVASKNLRYINVSGNNGMATGGSGDVLCGIIAGLLSGGLKREEAATLGVYLHGLAGDYAAKEFGTYSMLARDIIEALPKVLMNYERRSL